MYIGALENLRGAGMVVMSVGSGGINAFVGYDGSECIIASAVKGK